MIDITKIRYPELNQALFMYPGPQILLGHDLYWTMKEDGSNIGCYLDETGEVQFRTRNMDKASPDFYKYMEGTEEYPKIKELLESSTDWNSEYVLFGELLTKGKSPTRIELHEKTRFVAFDLYTTRQKSFITYNALHQQCYHFDIPIVELLGTCNVIDLPSLWEFRDQMLDICRERRKEGVVAKGWDKMYKSDSSIHSGRGLLYFKEKLDTPKLEKIPRVVQEGLIQLPALPDSEVYGAIEKARADIGDTDFMNIKKAMPLVAQYVGEEMKKHHCATPSRKLFDYYQDRCQELRTAEGSQ